MLKKANRIFDFVLDFLAVLAGLLIVAVGVITLWEVFMRYFFSKASEWVIPYVSYGIGYITFLGAAWTLKKERHVIIGTVLEQLEPRAQAMFHFIASIIGATVCLVITVYGAQATVGAALTGYTETTGELFTPKWMLIGIVPLASLLLLIQFLRRAVWRLRQWKAAK